MKSNCLATEHGGNRSSRGAASAESSSTCDTGLQYGCVLGMGNKDSILPPGVFVPLSTQPTCLGSHVNLYASDADLLAFLASA